MSRSKRRPERPLLCRFLDAGGTEALHTRGGPASKKRQGTKSRGAGQRLGGERYGDFRLGPHSMGGATLRRRDLHAFTRRRARGRKKRPEADFEGRQRAPGALIAVNWVERDRRRRGASAPERGCGGARKGSLAHDVSNLPGRRAPPRLAAASEDLDDDSLIAQTRQKHRTFGRLPVQKAWWYQLPAGQIEVGIQGLRSFREPTRCGSSGQADRLTSVRSCLSCGQWHH